MQQILGRAKNFARSPYRVLRKKYLRSFRGFRPADLRRVLRENGIKWGDAIFVHSGMEGFAGFHGSVPDIVRVFQQVAGPNGTLMMPTLPFAGSAIDYAKSNRTFNPLTTPSRVGLLTEIFRRFPDVKRSIHPTHPIAIWGACENRWIENHGLADTPCGRDTPFDFLFQRNGKIILAGVTIECLTFFHYAEELLEPLMPFSPFTVERYRLSCRVNGQIVESGAMRLYKPEISRHRRLALLAAELQKAHRWKEGRTGTLKVVVLSAQEVLQTLYEMADRGVFCYEMSNL
jgi:aminoglycoside 3-N-acetyltransferase